MKLSPAVLSTATESVLLKQYKLLGAVIDAPWATRLDHKIARHVIESNRSAPPSVLWAGLNTRPCREPTPALFLRVGSRCRRPGGPRSMTLLAREATPPRSAA